MKWTQQELADRMTARRVATQGDDAEEVTRYKIMNIESGETALKTEFRREIAAVMNVPEEAITLVDPTEPLGTKAARILTGLQHLGENELDFILRQVELLRPKT